MGMIKLLKPCPFCGKIPTWESCDRLIQISCNNCNYTRSFDGLISCIPSGVPVRYEGGVISTTEFYHADAHEKAIEAWNTRKGVEDGDNKAIDTMKKYQKIVQIMERTVDDGTSMYDTLQEIEEVIEDGKID